MSETLYRGLLTTLGPVFTRPFLEVAQMEAAAYIQYVNSTGNGSSWKSLSQQSQAQWIPERPGAFLAEQKVWRAATLEFLPEASDARSLRDRLDSCNKSLRRLLWLLVRVMPGLFGEILPELNHVKQELEVPRCTGAFAVRRSSSVKSEPASGMRAEIPLKSEPVPATSPVQASGSPESEPLPATSPLQVSGSLKSEQRSLPSPLRASGQVKPEAEDFYEDVVAQLLQPYVAEEDRAFAEGGRGLCSLEILRTSSLAFFCSQVQMGEMLSWGGLLHAIVQVAEEHLGACWPSKLCLTLESNESTKRWLDLMPEAALIFVVVCDPNHSAALAIARGEQEAFLFDGKHNAQIRKRASDFLSHVSKKHNFQYKLSMETCATQTESWSCGHRVLLSLRYVLRTWASPDSRWPPEVPAAGFNYTALTSVCVSELARPSLVELELNRGSSKPAPAIPVEAASSGHFGPMAEHQPVKARADGGVPAETDGELCGNPQGHVGGDTNRETGDDEDFEEEANRETGDDEDLGEEGADDADPEELDGESRGQPRRRVGNGAKAGAVVLVNVKGEDEDEAAMQQPSTTRRRKTGVKAKEDKRSRGLLLASEANIDFSQTFQAAHRAKKAPCKKGHWDQFLCCLSTEKVMKCVVCAELRSQIRDPVPSEGGQGEQGALVLADPVDPDETPIADLGICKRKRGRPPSKSKNGDVPEVPQLKDHVERHRRGVYRHLQGARYFCEPCGGEVFFQRESTSGWSFVLIHERSQKHQRGLHTKGLSGGLIAQAVVPV